MVISVDLLMVNMNWLTKKWVLNLKVNNAKTFIKNFFVIMDADVNLFMKIES